MSVLDKIIYIADYIEPNRCFDGVEELRRLAVTDLNAAMRLGLQMTMNLLKEHLTRRGYEVISTREPGGCPISERIRELLLSMDS